MHPWLFENCNFESENMDLKTISQSSSIAGAFTNNGNNR